MIRIAILGSDSSHTEAYSNLLNAPGAVLGHRARVTRIWGVDEQQTREKAAACRIPQVAASPEEAVRDVDAVMVLNRYGDEHYANAIIVMEAGLPTFVDKPMTNDLTEALALVRLARLQKVPLMACSPYRHARPVVELRCRVASSLGKVLSGTIAGPGFFHFQDPRSRHPFFYGIHLTEILVTVFGAGVEWVHTSVKGKANVVVASYPDGRSVTIHFLLDGHSYYHIAVYGSEGWAQASMDDNTDIYPPNLAAFLDMVDTGVPPTDLDEVIAPVAVMTAIQQSVEEHRPVKVRDLLCHAT